MDQSEIEAGLVDLPLGKIRYFETVGSTNDLAANWVVEGVPDLSLVVANVQTAGRGRAGRQWHTPPGASLAFSLILYPIGLEITAKVLSSVTGLGALVVCEALSQHYGLAAEIKWPNDVLLEGRKFTGVLAEAHWIGSQLGAIILGIGINIAPFSVPPTKFLNFPATCVEAVLGKKVARVGLLRHSLAALLDWRPRLNSPAFIQAWENRLAFRNEWVHLRTGTSEMVEGKILGLTPDGHLKLLMASGDVGVFQSAEVHLRPAAHH